MGSCIYLLFATFTILFIQNVIGAPTHPTIVSEATSQLPKLEETSSVTQETLDLSSSQSSDIDPSSEPSSSLEPIKEADSKNEQPVVEEAKVLAPTYGRSDDSKDLNKPESEVAEPEPQIQPELQPEVVPSNQDEKLSSPKDEVSSPLPEVSPSSEASTTLRQREVDVMDATTAISVKYVQGIPAQPIPLPDHLAVAAEPKPSGTRHGTFRFASFEPFFQMSEAGQLGILYDSEGALARHERDSSPY